MLFRSITALFPNIYDVRQLKEFATATDTPPFTESEYAQVQALYANNFSLEEAVAIA